jgi:hypothetical protein
VGIGQDASCLSRADASRTHGRHGSRAAGP